MATPSILALRAIHPVDRIIQGGFKGVPNPPAVNPERQLRKQKMAAMGFTSGKSFRRYRLAINRDYRAEGLSD